MSAFTFRSLALATAFLGLLLAPAPPQAAPKKISDWGFICKGAEGDARDACCTSKQTDCVTECNDNYQGAARETCLGLCRKKGDTCRGEVAQIRVPQGVNPGSLPKLKKVD